MSTYLGPTMAAYNSMQVGQSGGGMDPITMAIMAASNLFSGLFSGGGGGGSFVPTEQGSVTQNKIGAESEIEQLLASLQQQLAAAMMSGDFASPGSTTLEQLERGDVLGFNPTQLAAGEIGATARNRIEDQAYGALEDAGRRAMVGATESAMGRGLGLSSTRDSIYGEMMQPLISSAASRYGDLYNQELGRQTGLWQTELSRLNALRQQALQNSIALQDSPALQRLLQIRMAESTQGNYSEQVEAGHGYMDWAKEGIMGESVFGPGQEYGQPTSRQDGMGQPATQTSTQPWTMPPSHSYYDAYNV